MYVTTTRAGSAVHKNASGTSRYSRKGEMSLYERLYTTFQERAMMAEGMAMRENTVVAIELFKNDLLDVAKETCPGCKNETPLEFHSEWKQVGAGAVRGLLHKEHMGMGTYHWSLCQARAIHSYLGEFGLPEKTS